MASSLVSRPHLTPRPVRAATMASPSRARVAAGGLGGRGVAAGVRCQAQAAGDLDRHYMRRCVELARKAAGHTSPNPMVGCVIVRDGRVVGAIGVSTGTVEQDQEVAEAGAAAF